MAIQEESQSFNWRLKEWFPDLADKVLLDLKHYADALVKFNKTINLVSDKTIPFLDVLHFADSINAFRILIKDAKKVPVIHDFGSGNGFPGLVFGILNRDMRVVLVDSDTRKIEFLKNVISDLKLVNVSTLNNTVESIPADSVTFAISRGFANISKSILLTRKCIKSTGVYYHMKSEQWGLEVSEIPIQLCSIWNPALVEEYRLPNIPVKFALVKTTKV